MFIIFGLSAILFAILNVISFLKNKDAKWYRFISLSLTALTLCSFYADGASMVISKDWDGLTDVMFTVSGALWLCTVASILINSVSLIKRNN